MRHLAVALNASTSGIYCVLFVTVNLLCTSAAAEKITSDSNDTKHSQEICKGTRLNESRLLQSFTIFTEPDRAEETHFMALFSISNQPSFLEAEYQEIFQINMPIINYISRHSLGTGSHVNVCVLCGSGPSCFVYQK